MKKGDKIIVDYESIVLRQAQLNSEITERQIKDPDNKNKEFVEKNLINLGAMQMINEIIELYPTISEEQAKNINLKNV